MTAAAFPKQGGVYAQKLLVKRDDCPLEESEGDNLWACVSLFFIFQKPPDNHSIKIFHKSLAIFFASAESCHILSTEEADDVTRGSAKHQASKKLK
jgi:hypothetical protein